jgi:hypothetical protein
MNRREFLRTLTRGLALGGLAGLGWVLARRKSDCINRSICESCRRARACALPAAQTYRAKRGA